MTSIVLTVPLCLTGSLLSMVSIILLPATNLSLISTEDRASNKNMHLLITFVFAIEKKKKRGRDYLESKCKLKIKKDVIYS
jgi:hypothetical protein